MWKWTHSQRWEQARATWREILEAGGRASAVSLPLQEPVQKIQAAQSVDDFHPDVTRIVKPIVIKGELSASENVYLDGELEGSIELRDSDLTVGPNGRIRARLQARNIVVHGRVNGKLHGVERVELKKSAAVVGDIFTKRIFIEYGAQVKGDVLVQKDLTARDLPRSA